MQGWKKCIEKHGDYVEKLCYYKFSIFIEINYVSVVRIIIDSLTYFLEGYTPIRIVSILHTVNLKMFCTISITMSTDSTYLSSAKIDTVIRV